MAFSLPLASLRLGFGGQRLATCLPSAKLEWQVGHGTEALHFRPMSDLNGHVRSTQGGPAQFQTRALPSGDAAVYNIRPRCGKAPRGASSSNSCSNDDGGVRSSSDSVPSSNSLPSSDSNGNSGTHSTRTSTSSRPFSSIWGPALLSRAKELTSRLHSAVLCALTALRQQLAGTPKPIGCLPGNACRGTFHVPSLLFPPVSTGFTRADVVSGPRYRSEHGGQSSTLIASSLLSPQLDRRPFRWGGYA